ncbi:MAG: HAD family hydrolase [Elusimicrobia bacterium]|nr:HAD family hydrolase [Elusimicrobiota bacterium]
MSPRRANPTAPVIFLDRDGTLIEDPGYLTDPEAVRLLPRVVSALRLMRHERFRLVLVTNQSAVARGYLSRNGLEIIHRRLKQVLRARGVTLDGWYYCPHHPEARCRCRKPEPGLLRRAARELGCSLKRTYSIGDRWSDVVMGQRVGGKGLLVLTGLGRKEWRQARKMKIWAPDAVVKDLYAAARWIIRAEKKRVQ